MDLDDFEEQSARTSTKLSSQEPRDASRYLDQEWWVQASRSARWMDLIGDYAGTEPFVLDGESLIQMVLDDPLLALGNASDGSFQLAHALYLLEKLLNEFITRSAVFDVVFWTDLKHLTIRTGDSPWVTKSRSLARALLIQHLANLNVAVYTFKNITDHGWARYKAAHKPMFVMLNDGTIPDGDEWSMSPATTLIQRTFIHNLLTEGVSVTLLQGCEFRNSKILTFVFEQRFDPTAHGRLSRTFWEVTVAAEASLSDLEKDDALAVGSKGVDDNAFISLDDGLSSLAKQFSATNPAAMDKTLFEAFAAHCVLLEQLPISARAQRLPSTHPDLLNLLCKSLLPQLFGLLGSIVPLSSRRWLDIDGRVFLCLLHFLITNPEQDLKTALGETLTSRIDAVLASTGLSDTNINDLRTAFPAPPAESNEEEERPISPRPLLPFSHPVFDEDLEDVNVHAEIDSEDSEHDDHMHFGQGTVFKDTAHWHNHKRAILPKYLGGEDPKPKTVWERRKKLKREQRFMANMNKNAQSLTGALGVQLQRQVIPLAGKGGKDTKESKRTPQAIAAAAAAATNESVPAKGKGKKEKEPKLSSADKLRAKIKAEKTTKSVDGLTVWWDEQLAKMAKMNVRDRIAQTELLQRSTKAKEGWLAVELRLWRLHLELTDWIGQDNPEADAVRDRYTVSIMRLVKALYEMEPLTPGVLSILASVLTVLGFSDFIPTLEASFEGNPTKMDSSDRKLRFDFVKLIKSKTGSVVHKYMKIKEDPVVWQLRLFGEFMDRSMDSTTDRRVLFKPDAWQRKVLDCLDEDDHSVLVVAPTSAGKTFISYYAMEKVLRNSNDGILVYVAPTKALVAQIAAEVYARFSKSLTSGSVWAVHTRDYRVNDPQHCQILVTVPEVLAIMLLSPPLARSWTPRIKRIILDEIHSIGQQEGGAVWEQILLLAPCPIIGLSATIGEPEKFNKWLESVQTAHGYKHSFIVHPHRYSHLRKYVYVMGDKKSMGSFAGLDLHSNTGNTRFIHPISALAFGARGLPADLALESQDTLSLQSAFVRHKDKLSTVDISSLEPTSFFKEKRGFLTQLDIINYESALKNVLLQTMAGDAEGAAETLPEIIQSVDDRTLSAMSTGDLNSTPNKMSFKNNLISLVSDLHVSGDLPGILFSFDRSYCEIIGRTLLEALTEAEEKWKKSSPQWQRKLQEWERWKSQSKQRDRDRERMKKATKSSKKGEDGEDQGGGPAEMPDSSWESSFDPDDPQVQFSFAGVGKYSLQELEDEVQELARWSGVADWILQALRRGIAIHHAGMNKAYRSLIEALFRQGFVRVMIATGTLALGINAPAKTAVFCGDSPWLTALMYRQCAGRAGRRGFDLLGKVVFYGIPMDRIHRLMLSKLPSIGGNFPLTSTMCLRLLNLVVGSDNAPTAVKAVRSLLVLPQISVSSEGGRDQILHHLRFSLDYLRRAKLLDASGIPLNLYGIAAHLYYTEPSNLALVALFRAGIIHQMCNQPSLEKAKRDFVLLLANLFGRRYLPRAYLSEENLQEVIKRSPSIVILPGLSKDAQRVLATHDQDILRVFTDYAISYATTHEETLGEDSVLPLSHAALGRLSGDEDASPFVNHLEETAIPVRVRSPFIATSGLSDRFDSVEELTSSVRRGLHLDRNAVPSMGEFVQPKPAQDRGKKQNKKQKHDARSGIGQSQVLNAYLYDFYTHGQTIALERANGIRRGEVWYLLQEFDLVLMTVRGVVEQLLLRAGMPDGKDEDDHAEAGTEVEEQSVLDSGYGTGTAVDDDDLVDGPELKRPRAVSDRDWQVYVVIDAALREFNEKFKAMWA